MDDDQSRTEDISLYASWKINTYTVTFDSVGGSAVATQTVNWNTAPTLTTPTKDGYNFVGWFNGETKYTDGAITPHCKLSKRKTAILPFHQKFFYTLGYKAITTQLQ